MLLMLGRVWEAKKRPTVSQGKCLIFLEGAGDFSFSYLLPVAAQDSPPNANPSLACSISSLINLDFNPLLLDQAPSLKAAGCKILFLLLNFSPYCQRVTNRKMSAA